MQFHFDLQLERVHLYSLVKPHLLLDTGLAKMNYGFSGYLVDENKSLGGGISGGGTAPIANASITRDMLSQEVLDEQIASITILSPII